MMWMFRSGSFQSSALEKSAAMRFLPWANGGCMMTWNYRVFREEDGDYIIREVFYAEDGSIVGCTANAVEPFGSTLEELAQSIEDFKAALTLPVLSLNDIPGVTGA
jgi:hypothetical protein